MTQASFKAEGRSVFYAPGADFDAGTVIVQGDLIGVPGNDLVSGIAGALAVQGLFAFPKITGAIGVGVRIYWNPTADPVSGTAGTGAASTVRGAGGKLLGISVLAAESDDPNVQVLRALPTGPDLSNLITDPGNAGAIPVTDDGSVQLVTTGAQTRTLAAPTYVGQMLALSMKTDGGDCVVTASAGVNQTGNNTLTFNDAGDTLVLIGIESGANKRWRVVSNDGVTLSTV